jgi:tight adherence protein B
VSKLRGLGLLVAVALVAVPSAVAGGIRVGGDVSSYPRLVVNVVTARPVAKAPRLSEDGTPVYPLSVVNLGRTKSIVLAIDTSRSMAGNSLSDATAAARAFVDAKAGGDRISLVSFGSRVLQLTSFSTSAAEADGVLGSLHVDRRQGTALYDAVTSAARSLEDSTEAGRVIILVTDGRDVSSHATIARAVSVARAANAAIYPIGIESRDFDPTPLKQLASETGGTYHGAGSSAALQQVYTSIASELERTWRIAYDTTARPGDNIALHVTVPGAGSTDTALVAPGHSTSTSAGPLPSVAYTPLGTFMIALLVGALVLSALFALIRLHRGSWVSQRLAPHITETRRRAGSQDRMSLLKALFRATEGAFGRREKWRLIEKMLVRADLPLRPAEFFWLSFGCGVIGGLIAAIVGVPALIVLAAMGGTGMLPYAFVWYRVRSRSKAFEAQLPDLLATIAASLKAGHSFKHGLQAVAEESQPPASIELRRVLTEAGLGRPLDDALGDMADRVGSENFEFAITAVTIQRQVGGSLASLFDMVADTVRNRQQFARKIRSLTAMGRMSAYTLIGIPFFIAGMISVMNADYMKPLFHTTAGHVMLLLGLTMMAIGSMILKKIVSFRG